MMSAILFWFFLLWQLALAQRLDFSQYIIQNNCFYPIMLWDGYGTYDTVLSAGGNVTYFRDLDSGPYYTDAHCGDPTGDTSTKAFFHLSVRPLALN